MTNGKERKEIWMDIRDSEIDNVFRVLIFYRFILSDFLIIYQKEMTVKELIEKLKNFDWDKEIYLRIWYIEGKSDRYLNFTVSENSYAYDDEVIVNIEPEEDIEPIILWANCCDCPLWRNW